MKLIRWLTIVLLGVAVAAAFLGWRKVGELRAENEVLRTEIQNLKMQRNAAAEAQLKQRDQELQKLRTEAQEVHRLRNEVSQFRAGTREAEKLRAENQQLRTVASSAPTAAAPATGPADQFPRESWAFAGYATPEVALVSAVWAMREGNPQTYLDSLSPEEQARMAKAWQNQSAAEIAAKHQQDVASITGVRILERQTVSPGEVLLNVYVEGTGKMEKISMKRYGNEWKFSGIIRNAAK